MAPCSGIACANAHAECSFSFPTSAALLVWPDGRILVCSSTCSTGPLAHSTQPLQAMHADAYGTRHLHPNLADAGCSPWLQACRLLDREGIHPERCVAMSPPPLSSCSARGKRLAGGFSGCLGPANGCAGEAAVGCSPPVFQGDSQRVEDRVSGRGPRSCPSSENEKGTRRVKGTQEQIISGAV